MTVAEVQRDVIKQLGVDLNGSLGSGTSLVGFQTINPFTALGEALSSAKTIDAKFKSVEATLRAMERAGVVRTLAEPTLTAISGESANFLAGGEFPIVSGTSGPPNFTPTVDFKKFGVSLNFTPVVLSQGRISLKSDDGSLRTLHGRGLAVRRIHHSFTADTAGRYHDRNSVRRLARLGRIDPGTDETADQRSSWAHAGARFSARCLRAATTSITRPSL